MYPDHREMMDEMVQMDTEENQVGSPSAVELSGLLLISLLQVRLDQEAKMVYLVFLAGQEPREQMGVRVKRAPLELRDRKEMQGSLVHPDNVDQLLVT